MQKAFAHSFAHSCNQASTHSHTHANTHTRADSRTGADSDVILRAMKYENGFFAAKLTSFSLEVRVRSLRLLRGGAFNGTLGPL